METLKKFFLPPVFDNEDDNTKARLLNGFSWLVIALLLIAMALLSGTGFIGNSTIYILAGIAISFVIALILLKRRQLTVGSYIVILLSWVGITFQAYLTGGMRDVIVIAYIAVTLMASLLINIWAAITVLIFSIGSLWGLVALELNGYITPSFDTLLHHARDLSLIFIIIAILIYFATNSLSRALKISRTTAQELAVSNQELVRLRLELETRVAARTTELAELTQRSERRAALLQTIAEIARAAIAIKEIDELLPNITRLISRRFEFYHVGIFAPDEKQENMLLVAANSEGGRRMLQRHHKLAISPRSIVGYAAANRRPRIALDVGADAVYFDNPDLPDTHSEMALPLIASEKLIGVLDVQSTETNAFSQDDIDILSTLADQLTVAIENARLFEETHQALVRVENFHRQNLGRAWYEFTNRVQEKGYHFENGKTVPIQHDTVSDKSLFAIPLRISGQTIGTLKVRSNKKSRQLTPEERALLSGVAERAALALENARLLEESRVRAAKEQAISQATAHIASATDIERILKTTAEELERSLGSSEIIIQLESKE